MSILVVTGICTGVGKTVVSAAVALLAREAGLSVAYVKPAQTCLDYGVIDLRPPPSRPGATVDGLVPLTWQDWRMSDPPDERPEMHPGDPGVYKGKPGGTVRFGVRTPDREFRPLFWVSVARRGDVKFGLSDKPGARAHVGTLHVPAGATTASIQYADSRPLPSNWRERVSTTRSIWRQGRCRRHRRVSSTSAHWAWRT